MSLREDVIKELEEYREHLKYRLREFMSMGHSPHSIEEWINICDSDIEVWRNSPTPSGGSMKSNGGS